MAAQTSSSTKAHELFFSDDEASNVNRETDSCLPWRTSLTDINQLYSAVFGCIRIASIEQLLLAKTYCFYSSWTNSEWIDERLANSIRPLLAQSEIVFATSLGVRMPHN